MIRIYFDGACEPVNPGGTAAYGFVIKGEDGRNIVARSAVVGRGKGMTNNVAEYSGLIAALRELRTFNEKERVEILGDSKLVVEMVGRRWGYERTASGKIKGWNPHREAPHLRKLLDEVLALLDGREYATRWIPREQNQECDDLSKEHAK